MWRGHRAGAVVIILMTGCGRLGFDAASDASRAVDGAVVDALPPTTFGPGTFTYVVPAGCASLRVRIWGGGGGGGGDFNDATVGPGQPGGTTSFDTMAATGGQGGDHGNISPMSSFLGGMGGGASGGDIVVGGTSGGSGNAAVSLGTSGPGGTAPSGGIGGAGVSTANTNGLSGGIPGAGGSGAQGGANPAAGGGSGGFAERVRPVTAGAMFALVVGQGGVGGTGTYVGGPGADGQAVISCE